MLAGTVTSSNLQFGTQRVGTVSAAQSVSVTNVGTTTFQVTALTTTGPFSVSPNVSFTLTPGQSRALSVVFAPTAVGPFPGTLTISTNDPANPSLIVDLSGTGVQPTIVLSANSLAFGEQRVGTVSAALSVTVSNTGTASLNVSAVSISGGGAFTVTPSSAFTLAPAESRMLSVMFAPPAEGIFTSTLTLSSDAPASPAVTVNLLGSGVRPALILNPGALAFGDRAVGTSSTQTVTVLNVGTGTLEVTGQTLAGSPAFAVPQGAPFSIPPNASRQLTVMFSPTSVGAANATLTLQSNDPSNPAASVNLTGMGVSGELRLSLPTGAPITSLDFGAVRVGSTRQQTVRLTNSGQSPVTVQAPAQPAGPFFSSGLGAVTIPPGAFVDFQVVFQPAIEATFSSSLTIPSNATNSPTELGLTGRGVTPELEVDRTSLLFGDVRVGSESNRMVITVSNTGSVDATVQNLPVVGPFAVVPGAPLPRLLPPASSFTFEVVFKPTAQGLATGTVSIVHEAGALNVALSGTGTVARLELSVVSLDFGAQRVNTTSGPQPVIFTNTGSAELEITAFIFSNASFAVTAPLPPPSPTVPLRIAPGQQQAVSLTFAPSALGQIGGRLFIISNAQTPTPPVELRGKGVDGQLSLTPSAVSFPGVGVGGPPGQQTVVLTNTGEASLTITGVSPPSLATFSISGLPAGLVLQPGANWTFTVSFAPTQRGYVSASAAIQSDAVVNPFANLPLEGTGIGPVVELAPTSLNFGRSNVGVGTAQSLALRNVGERDLLVSNMSFADGPSGPSGAALDFSVGGGTVFPLLVRPGESQVVQLTFTPQAVGSRQARVIVHTNDRPVEASLVGEGSSPVLSLSETQLSFGNVRVGVSSAPRILRISNTGNGPLTLNTLVVGGADAAAFTALPPVLPLTLQPGSFTEVSVVFRPDSVRAFAAQLRMDSNQRDMPSVIVPLTGTGTGAGSPVVRISPSVINFGQQLINSLSGPRKLRLINDTSSSATLTALSVQGVGASQFSLSEVTLPRVLAPGEELEVEVRFTPLAEEEVMSTLRLAFSDNPQPSEVPLLGKGIPAVLSIRPSPVNFGVVRPGGPKSERSITLSNLSSDPIILAAPEVTYTTGAPFTYDAVGVTGRTLEPGASLIVNVGYQPQAESLSETTLAFGTTTPSSPRSAEVQLKGLAAQRLLIANPGSLSFGEVAVNQSSEPQVVTVTNRTAQSQQVVVMLKDSAGAPFQVDAPALANPLAAGGSATFTVRFQPQQAGQASNEVQVWLLGESQPETQVPVSGTGTGPGGGEEEEDGGGCSCGSTDAGSAGMMGLLVLVALAARRRRTA